VRRGVVVDHEERLFEKLVAEILRDIETTRHEAEKKIHLSSFFLFGRQPRRSRTRPSMNPCARSCASAWSSSS
jgi:hypothetical protein